jgi:hypothetical protein
MKKDAYLQVIEVLVLSSILDLVLNRTLPRVGIFIPKQDWGVVIYQGLYLAGGVVFNFTVLLTFGVSAYILYLAFRGRLWLGNFGTPLALGVFLLLFLNFVSLKIQSPGLSFVYTTLSALVLLTIIFCIYSRGGYADKLFIALFGLGIILYRYHVGSQLAFQILHKNVLPPFAAQAFLLGEIFTVLAAIAALSYARTPDPPRPISVRKPFLIALVPTASLAVLAWLNFAMLSAISIWTVGYAMSGPFPIYIAAVFAITFAIIKNFLAGKKDTAYGLTLMFVAGYAQPLIYQNFLAMLGLLTLSRSAGK